MSPKLPDKGVILREDEETGHPEQVTDIAMPVEECFTCRGSNFHGMSRGSARVLYYHLCNEVVNSVRMESAIVISSPQVEHRNKRVA